MSTNRDTKQYAGGILNRIHRVCWRTGEVNVRTSDGYPDQTTAVRTVIGRTSAEPPVERTQQQDVKNNDV